VIAVAVAMLWACKSGPTPESCPSGRWVEEPIQKEVKTGETCIQNTVSTPKYDSKGNYLGADSRTETSCIPKYSATGPVTGYKKVWSCPGVNAERLPANCRVERCPRHMFCFLGGGSGSEAKCLRHDCLTNLDCEQLGSDVCRLNGENQMNTCHMDPMVRMKRGSRR
jgi:hypothetical protein